MHEEPTRRMRPSEGGGYEQPHGEQPGARPPGGMSTGGDAVLASPGHGEPWPALRRSLDAQEHPAAAVEPLKGDLRRALRGLLEGEDADALVLVAPDDALDPRALARIATRLAAEDPPDLLYSDDDRLDGEGRRCDPFLKPGWSPELLLSLDYVGSFVAVGRRAAEAALRACAKPIASAYALLLRLVDEPLRVERIPEVLCTHGGTPEPDPAEEELLEVARRRDRRLELVPRDGRNGARRLRWAVEGEPLVSVIIPTKGRPDPLEPCLQSLLERSSYRRLELVLVDSGGEAEGTAAPLLRGVEHRVVPYRDDRFNFSRACNLGAEAASGELLLYLNDDTEVVTPEWIELLVAQAQLPSVGIAGAKLVYPGGLVQCAGVWLYELGTSDTIGVRAAFAFLPADSSGYHGLLSVPRDCAAVPGACMMIPSGVLEEIGGWDERMRVDYGDVEIGLRANEAGWRVVVEPRAVLLHREAASRPRKLVAEDIDRDVFLARWRSAYGSGDPWYHPEFGPGFDYELG